MKRKKGPVIEGQSAYATEIPYLARLVSDGNGTGHAYENSSKRDTDATNGAVFFAENSESYKEKSLVIDAYTFKDKQRTNVRWYDQGTIQMMIPEVPGLEDENGNLKLKSGSYESTIYIHIVTDFIPKNAN